MLHALNCRNFSYVVEGEGLNNGVVDEFYKVEYIVHKAAFTCYRKFPTSR